jgi:hypothetical protein
MESLNLSAAGRRIHFQFEPIGASETRAGVIESNESRQLGGCIA